MEKRQRQFGEGAIVQIPCRIQRGAFNGEYLITLDVDGKEVSGFVREEVINRTSDNSGFIRGMVIHIERDYLTLKIEGSLFTGASGKTYVSSDWAGAHLAAG